MLFDIDNLCWDEELCAALGIPDEHAAGAGAVVQQVYGRWRQVTGARGRLRASRSAGSAGDQQAALFGPGLLCAGPGEEHLRHRLLHADEHRQQIACAASAVLVTSVAWSSRRQDDLCARGQRVQCRQRRSSGCATSCGLIRTAHECDILAERVPDNGGVYLVSGVHRSGRAALGYVRPRLRSSA